MKLRLKSHSVRFRLTVEDMSQLSESGFVSCKTIIPDSAGNVAVFRYGIQLTNDSRPSELQVSLDGFALLLNEKDFAELANDTNEAVYLRREWSDEQGQTQRTVIYVERDKLKGHKKEKHKKQGHQTSSHAPHGAEVASPRDSRKEME